MRSRRSLLRTGGLAAVGTLGGLVALPSPPEATPTDQTVEAAALPDAVSGWTDDRITRETETPIARYQYRATAADPDRTDRETFVATSPINVVLVPNAETDAAGLESVMEVLEAKGWLRDPDEYTRYAWDRTEGRFVRQQATAAESYFGASGRFHVRCWSFEGVVSMQVHEDSAARPKHDVISYDRGRKSIAAAFDAAGWDVSPGAIDLDNDQSDHDGLATVVTEAP
ncbi:hypothetical protein JMJ58_09200 [Haloterrigena salifodinae]|uniref:Uncharacterized protein n=1 Tax=Haloterrigena salifodinae TaxID=2675099 RepID=A0A8T8E5K2_9EURY|nr:hypothetical protein [Haloterrigena salifodinae]QRV17019.1 hypothetical protein JMJ58_09200 [Haloterrigena salifodinae]